MALEDPELVAVPCYGLGILAEEAGIGRLLLRGTGKSWTARRAMPNPRPGLLCSCMKMVR